MKRLLISLIISSLSLLVFGQETITRTLIHDNLQREYIIYVPASYTGAEAVPVVFNFHGFGSNATEQMFYGDFRAIADTENFIVVHPEGTLFNGVPHWNVGGWTVGSTTDDVGFTLEMINQLSVSYNIDHERIYSTGMSNGGYMSFLLACQLSDKIAAIASVTGSMTPQTTSACAPEHPTPILQIHSVDDGVVPYGGAFWSNSIADVLAYWVNYNVCDQQNELNAFPNIDTNDGSTVESWLYPNGENGSVVQHYKITGGGHTWPGAAFDNGATNQDINASVEIWNFFNQYDINGLRSGSTSVDNLSDVQQIKLFPNPISSNRLYLTYNSDKISSYAILSSTGELIQQSDTFHALDGIDISSLSTGVYLLKIDGQIQKFIVTK